MRIPAWVRHLAFHPVVVSVARGSMIVIAAGVLGIVGIQASTNQKISDVQTTQTEKGAADELRFQAIEAKIVAGSVSTDNLSRRVDLSREDRLAFQEDTTSMLRTIITQNQTILANQAASAVRMDNFDDRLKRIENGARQ